MSRSDTKNTNENLLKDTMIETNGHYEINLMKLIDTIK